MNCCPIFSSPRAFLVKVSQAGFGFGLRYRGGGGGEFQLGKVWRTDYFFLDISVYNLSFGRSCVFRF